MGELLKFDTKTRGNRGGLPSRGWWEMEQANKISVSRTNYVRSSILTVVLTRILLLSKLWVNSLSLIQEQEEIEVGYHAEAGGKWSRRVRYPLQDVPCRVYLKCKIFTKLTLKDLSRSVHLTSDLRQAP